MSARVVNPFSLNEMRRLREAVAARPASFRPDPEAKARVSRNLWGKTTADDSRAFAAREMAEQRERATERWGFDFLREVPRTHGSGAQRYRWTRVRVGTVPAAYRMPGLVLDRVLETARATVPFVAVAPAQQQLRQEAASLLTAPIVPAAMVSGRSSPSTTSAADSPVAAAQQQQRSQEAAVPLMAPIVPVGMVSPDLSGLATSITTTSATGSPAAPAPTRQMSITDFLQCRKRTISGLKHEENPAKRRKADEASRV